MPVSASAVTLAEYAIMSNDPLVQAVTFSLIDAGSAMRDVPFVNKASLIANGVRWEGNLPSVSWKNINEEGDTTKGSPSPYQEQMYVVRNNIDVDHLLVQDTNQIVDPRAAQVEAYLQSVAYDFNDKFINNDHVAGEAKAPVGLRARIDDAAGENRYGVRPENRVAGGGVDLTQATATAATFATFTEFMDQLLWTVGSPEGDGVVLYMNDTLYRRISRFARQFSGAGGFSQGQDQLGRSVTMYKQAVIRDIGRRADQSTLIIGNAEAAGGGAGTNHTSVYAVHYGTSYFFGWQFAPLRAQNLGLMENGVIYRTFIEWTCGLMNASTRSIGRLHGIKVS